MRIVFWWLAAVLTLPVQAARIDRLEVAEQAGSYSVLVQASLDARSAAVWAMLSDYGNYPEIAPSIQSVEQLGPAALGGDLVRSQALVCVLSFCKEIHQVQLVSRPVVGELLAEIQPVGSDFSSGRAHWRVLPGGASSELRFEAEMRPKFWVPPLIGPWLVRRALEQEARASLHNLERMAQAPR